MGLFTWARTQRTDSWKEHEVRSVLEIFYKLATYQGVKTI